MAEKLQRELIKNALTYRQLLDSFLRLTTMNFTRINSALVEDSLYRDCFIVEVEMNMLPRIKNLSN